MYKLYTVIPNMHTHLHTCNATVHHKGGRATKMKQTNICGVALTQVDPGTIGHDSTSLDHVIKQM